MEKYLINKEIGSGSFGKVFTVESKISGIQYVVKQIDFAKLDKKQRASAEKEFQVLAKLKHPYIVAYKEAYTDEQYLHIVMELCENGDLHGRIQESRTLNQRFTDAQVLEYFVQITLALEYIHSQKILHRDLKTKNVFLTKANVVKLGDFGVAKILEDSLELARTCIGSPFYISPEICENKPYNKKSDIWALGCILYELTTLRYAFTANNMKLLLQKITSGDYQALTPSTNKNIRHIISRLLKSEPHLRPTATEILAIPFVADYSKKLSCRSKKNMPNITRCHSGGHLDNKPTDLKRKTYRSMLPISKSSLNLNCNTTDITEPEAKYKIKSLKNKLNNSIENKSKLEAKKVNLPRLKKADSLYYSMIEESTRRDQQQNLELVKNVFGEKRKYIVEKHCNVLKDVLEKTHCGEKLMETTVIIRTAEKNFDEVLNIDGSSKNRIADDRSIADMNLKLKDHEFTHQIKTGKFLHRSSFPSSYVDQKNACKTEESIRSLEDTVQPVQGIEESDLQRTSLPFTDVQNGNDVDKNQSNEWVDEKRATVSLGLTSQELLDYEGSNVFLIGEGSGKEVTTVQDSWDDDGEAKEGCNERSRKKWNTTTKDKEQLINLLSNADISTVFDTLELSGENIRRDQSIDDLLCMNTIDFCNDTVLQPEHKPRFPVQQPEVSLYEELEQRRMKLEKMLGLELFVVLYRTFEKQMEIEEYTVDGSRTYLVSECKANSDFAYVAKEHKNLVRELVRDDLIYRLQS